jgi:hypothetical protein
MYGFFISLCPAPSIDDADGQKRADCLSGTRAWSFSSFSDGLVKSPEAVTPAKAGVHNHLK